MAPLAALSTVSSLALGPRSSFSDRLLTDKKTMPNPNVQPLAPDFVVAAQVPDPKQYFFHDPNLTRLDGGTLLIAAPQWNRPGTDVARCLRILRSDDGGRSWEEGPHLPFEEGTPFVLGGQLLMFVQEKSHRNFQIVGSDDGGRSWSPPQTVIEKPVWNISTAMLVRPNALFWAMDHDLPGAAHNGKVMVRLDRKKSPFDPQAWSISNLVHPPEVPAALTRSLFPVGNRPQLSGGWKNPFVWLEPNTVEVGDRIRIFTRCVIDEYATAHTAAVLDYDPQANRLNFTQFASWPGAQCKLFLIHDQPRAMYWMLSNLVTNSQDLLGWGERLRQTEYHGGPGNERRWLFLHYSIDCLNWFPAGCIACWPNHVHRSFMYPSAVIDSDDLVVLSRTSRDSGDQHDADLCTVHRIPDFRSLAMDLHQGGLHR
jgi:hypothetical protein